MDRRKFLKYGAASVTVPLILNGHALQVLAADANSAGFLSNTNKILVLVQLDGGNDGLNTLIPTDQLSNLHAARGNVMISDDKIIEITTKQGLHPSLAEIGQLYQQEQIMFIQNVGYPQPNLSHFRSKEIVLSASDSKVLETTGWLGRYLTNLHSNYPEGYPNSGNPHPLAITINSNVSPTCQGNLANFGIPIQNTNVSYNSGGSDYQFPDTPYGNEMEYIIQTMLSTEKYLSVVGEKADLGQNRSNKYPEGNSLADKLKIVAKLISGGLQTKIYVVNLGGFDTHSKQVEASDTSTGKHATLMQKISQAIDAFQDDLILQGLNQRVLGLMYSEFGRRIASNSSNGTDHGAAYPMMLFGTEVNPTVYGANPQISNNVDKKDNLPWKIDFRQVYASILKHWFDASEQDIQTILFNDFDRLPILKSLADSDIINRNKTNLSIYPNPLINSGTIEFTATEGVTTIKLLNSNGQFVDALLNKITKEGEYQKKFMVEKYATGLYWVVMESGSIQETRKIIIHR